VCNGGGGQRQDRTADALPFSTGATLLSRRLWGRDDPESSGRGTSPISLSDSVSNFIVKYQILLLSIQLFVHTSGYSCKPAMSREPGGTAPQIQPVSFIKTVSVVLDIVINIRNHIEIVGLPQMAIFIG